MAYIVNGKEVEYLRITESFDGDTIVEYSEKFNIVVAHHGEIMKRLRANNLVGVQVFKDLQHDIISILFVDVGQVTGILHSLSIPFGCYDVFVDDLLIVVDVPVLLGLM